jgi:hypothetical protein
MAQVDGWMGATLNCHTLGVGCSGVHAIPDQKVGCRVGGCDVRKVPSITLIVVPLYWSFCPLPNTNCQPQSTVMYLGQRWQTIVNANCNRVEGEVADAMVRVHLQG